MFLQIVGANAGLHRYFAHQSFEVSKKFELFLAIISTLCGMGSVLSWILTHRTHHKYADQEKDCHSPLHLPIHKMVFSYWNPPTEVHSDLRSLRSKKHIMFLHKHYFLIQILWCLSLSVVNLKMVIYFYCLPSMLMTINLYGVVIFCHRLGYRNFPTPDNSKNNWIVAMLTFGEGWHNNHHQYPSRFSNLIRWYEIDITGLVIRFLFPLKNRKFKYSKSEI